MEARRRGQVRPRLRRTLVGLAVLVAMILAASVTVVASEGGERTAHADIRVGSEAGSAPAPTSSDVHRRHRGRVTWLHDPAAPMPAGVRPGHGHPTPHVLSPAQELADIGPLPAGWTASVHVLDIGRVARSYLVVAPVHLTDRARTLPLYLALHGRGATPDVMAHMTSLESDTGPAVVVYPAGYESSWNAGGCCGYAHADGLNDVAFIHDVVGSVLAAYPAVSPSRVYALGFSNGGRMTYRLACQLPGTFAGIAAVEAVPVIDCRHLRALDVEIIAQRRDPLLSISDEATRKTMDGYLEPTVTSAVSQWRALDGCGRAVTAQTVGGAEQRTWGCRDGTRLQYTLYAGGAHRWPRGRPVADRVILSLLAPSSPCTDGTCASRPGGRAPRPHSGA